MGAKREYKDTVFSKLFSEPPQLRELYNALADTAYGDDTTIVKNTLDDVFINGLKNDVSFTIDGKFIVLIEHQSTISKNMPLRLLMYIARIYEKITEGHTVYQEKLLKIPTPEFIILYNGTKPFPSEKTLRLSDAFISETKSPEKFGVLDLTVRVVNINPRHNEELLRRSELLSGYSAFVERVRYNQACSMVLEEAIREAVKWCIGEGILLEFLERHGSEVQNMLYTEFNLDIAKKVWQEEAKIDGLEEGLEKGRKEGRKEGRMEGKEEGHLDERKDIAKAMISDGESIEKIMRYTRLTREKIEQLRGAK